MSFVDLKVEGMGVLEPAHYREVRSELAASVSKVLVKTGDKVTEGSLLATLSDLELRIQLSQAENDLAASRAELQRRIEQHNLSSDHLNSVNRYIKVGVHRNGLVKQILVHQGQRVKKGDLLAQLSDFEDLAELHKVEEDLKISKAELERTIDKYKLCYSIYKDVIQDLPKVESLDDIPDIAVQRATVRKVTKEIKLITGRIKRTMIRAPVDGQVLSSNIEDLVGRKVVEGDVLMLIGIDGEALDAVACCARNPHAIPEIAEQEARIARYADQVSLLKDQLKKTNVYAPMTGTIITADLDRLPGKVFSKGETLMTVAQMDEWLVKAVIRERDVPKVKLGDRAKIKINAFPYMQFKLYGGEIIHIAPAPTQLVNKALIISDGDDEEDKIISLPYFTVTVRLDDSRAVSRGRQIDFQFGLVGNVNIIVSKKRTIDYFWDLFLGKLDLFGPHIGD